MDFRIQGLSVERFRHLFGLADDELAAQGARRMIADKKPGYPDRIELRDAEPGESLLLLNYTHQPAATPYRSSHAIFVLENAGNCFDRIGVVPDVLRSRLISLRAFDFDDMMIDAELIEGRSIEQAIARMLSAPEVTYLHAHYAARGCYAARIERA